MCSSDKNKVKLRLGLFVELGFRIDCFGLNNNYIKVSAEEWISIFTQVAELIEETENEKS